MRATRNLLATVLILTGTVAVVRAQEAPEAQQNDAGHGVARISVMAGDVSVQRGDSGERSAAAVNAPLVADDLVTTGPGSRAEIQFDSANMARLGSDSEVRLSELDGSRFQLQVARGTVMFSVLRDSRAQVEVSTPAVSIRPLSRGDYRISVFDDGQTQITVRSGEGDIYTPRGVEKLRSGNTMMVRGTASDPEFQVVRAIAPDDFDRWNEDRNRNLSRSQSYQHVGRDINGAEDLDSNGRWVQDANYGSVWTPSSVGPDWAPYREGRWVWEDWYGWTWVSDEPWGWAPYHYGRWFYSAPVGWCWYPGPYYAPHYWSPALVAFFGFGGFHVGVGFGGAGFGWVPLAPYETFHPWWGRGFYGGYRNHNVLVNNINIVNNVNIRNTYRNARVGNAVSVVNSGDFARGRFGSVRSVSGAQLNQASLVRGQVPIAPTAGSLRFSDRQTAAIPRSNVTGGRFFSHSQPAPVNRVPFAQQQQSLAQVSRPGSAGSGVGASPNNAHGQSMWQPQAVAPRAAQSPSTAAPSARNVPSPQSSMPRANAMGQERPSASAPAQSGGWRRFGDSPQASAPSQSPRSVQPGNQPRAAEMPSTRGSSDAASGGWRRFGSPSQPTSRGAAGAASGRGDAAPQDSSRGWRSPADRPATAQPGGDRFQSAPSDGWRRYQPSSERPGYGQSLAPRSESPRYQQSPSYSRPERLQIAPPIVRERAMPSSEPRYNGGGYSGGGGRSAPRVESAPRSGGYSGGGGRSAPQSAPRSSGGGGGNRGGSGSSGHSGHNR